jgi:hypothetical protein
VKLEATLLGRFTSPTTALASGRGKVRVLARRTRSGVRAGLVVTLRLRPSAALRRRLAREKRLPALLRIEATDAAGNVTTRTKPLLFR